MNTFANAIKAQKTQTTNGMAAYKSTMSACLDLFGQIGSSRTTDITLMFSKAYNEERELSLRIAQYARDVREGIGERKVYREILRYLEKANQQDAIALAVKTAELGRWDDLLVFEEKLTKHFAFDLIKVALEAENALCAKWMPRESASNAKMKAKAKELREYFGWSPKEYRKTLSRLSKTVEQQMCAKQWEQIEFSHVPSVAMTRYRKAFGKHQADRFQEYLDKVKSGETKINASVSMPHEIVNGLRHKNPNKVELDAITAQWDAMPNYIGDTKMIPIVDVSASMTWVQLSKTLQPLDVAIALGMYVSEKNTGPFNGCFLTFESTPNLVHLNGNITDRYRQIAHARVGGSTNLQAAFEKILQTAKDGNVAPEDMPEYVVILSDMQFNQATTNADDRALKMIDKLYATAGYERPKVIFWNLAGGTYDNVPVRVDDNGTAFVSGFSTPLFKALLSDNLDTFTPVNVMLEAVMKDRYAI